MKKELLYSLCITILLVAGVFFFIKKSPTTSSLQTVPTATNVSQTTALSLTEVQTHNSASDCFIIVDKKAYDVTSYLGLHPGGAETIIPYCGKDATQAFDAIKNGRGHSTQAVMDLDAYFVSDVK